MKNALLALALFAFVGTASAHEGKDGKKGKKETCAKATAAGSSCCMKKGAKTASVTPAPAAAPAVKSL
ncbi:hypothetical protein MUN84_00945 [Hymenobacter sp. 5516J-16]|uniref:Phosphate starvation-inducible protein PsiF n=1 Tax=Hymenobacter sublimis TaxID=2933777 RepID=A0ABY4JGA9_9BACT|nr:MULTISPECIES: hypothetical protein [Hymenobacter]UOQ77326.1 hypothetical protein MUN84_00945 [Hymenobacter sp. 5516J-16]UPL51004.1 hypothetical protein MWH26_08875 [Hymenobacter sublimis]